MRIFSQYLVTLLLILPTTTLNFSGGKLTDTTARSVNQKTKTVTKKSSPKKSQVIHPLSVMNVGF